MPKISILILLFEIYFHMALPAHLEEYNSISLSLIDLLNLDFLSSNSTLTTSPYSSISLIDSLNNDQVNKSSIFNNLFLIIEEILLLDKQNSMTYFMIAEGSGGEGSNIDLLTSLRLSTEIIIKNLLLFSSLLSLIIGTVLGLSQIKIKRLLAYSTISHVGFLLLCLAIKTEVSIESLIFYLIQYSFTNLNGFLILLAFGLSVNYLIDYKGIPSSFHHYLSKILINMKNIYNPLTPSLYKHPIEMEEKVTKYQNKTEILDKEKYKQFNKLRILGDFNLKLDKIFDNSYINPLEFNSDLVKKLKIRSEYEEYNSDLLFIKELRNQFKFNPALSLSFAITLFSMAGIPPFIGFFGKQSVIYSAIDSGFYFMTFIAILVSVISAVYYLKLIKEAYSPKDLSSASNTRKEVEVNNAINKYNQIDLKPINTSPQILNEKKEFSIMSSFITFLDYILKIENNSVDLKVLNLSSVHAFIISLLTFTILLFFVNTSILMNSASLITLNYFYL
jgi:hypothetical protein